MSGRFKRPSGVRRRTEASRPATLHWGIAVLIVLIAPNLSPGRLSAAEDASPSNRVPHESQAQSSRPLGAPAQQFGSASAFRQPRGTEPNACLPSAEQPLAPLETYKDTYILPYTYDTIGSPDRLAEEVKFQISIRKELFRCAPLHFYFGYSQLSQWQWYQPSNSRAFRISDYNPEFFFVLDGKPVSPLPGEFRFGIEHQSNGAGGVKERSWNRVYVMPFAGAADDWGKYSLKLWWRIPEGPKASPSNPGGDDNPDIEDFMGIFELRSFWTFGPYHQLGAMYRRGYRDGTDTVELDYDVTIGFPGSGVMARFQLFSGYGETLADYNRRVNRIGLGFVFH